MGDEVINKVIDEKTTEAVEEVKDKVENLIETSRC